MSTTAISAAHRAHRAGGEPVPLDEQAPAPRGEDHRAGVDPAVRVIHAGRATAVRPDPPHLARDERRPGAGGGHVDRARERARIERRLVGEEQRAARLPREARLEPSDRGLVEHLDRQPLAVELLGAAGEDARVLVVERDLERAERAVADRHPRGRLDLADEAGVARERGAAERVERTGLERLDAGREDPSRRARGLGARDRALEHDHPAARLREPKRDRRALEPGAHHHDVRTHGAEDYALAPRRGSDESRRRPPRRQTLAPVLGTSPGVPGAPGPGGCGRGGARPFTSEIEHVPPPRLRRQRLPTNGRAASWR